MLALEGLVSGLGFVIGALLLGVLMAPVLILPQEPPGVLRARFISVALILIICLLGVAVLSLLLQGAKLERGAFPSVDTLKRYLLLTWSGNTWLLRQLYALLFLAMLVLWGRRQNVWRNRIFLLVAVPLVTSRSLTSHAAAVQGDPLSAITADAIHLLGTGLWAGGVAMLFWSLREVARNRSLDAVWVSQAVHRFSVVAFLSVGVLVATGFYQSQIQVGSLDALWDNSYGLVFVLKLLLVAGMLTLGAVNFLSTRPMLARVASSPMAGLLWERKVLRRIGAESFLGFVVLVVTGFLTMLPPASHSAHVRVAKGRVPVLGAKLAPAEGASIQIVSPKSGQIFADDSVPVEFKIVKGKRGDHVHAYIDGELMGMFRSRRGTLTGIRPGRHTLEVRIVAEDHQTELEATDRVDFTVK